MVLKWIAERLKPADRHAEALARAQQLRMQDEFDAAREACLGVLRETPEHAPAMALLAAIAADQRQAEAGLQWATRALQSDPLCVPAHFARGRLLEGAERFAEAEASYRRVVELDPRHAKGHTNLGCMLHVQGRIPEAAACYRQALAIEPDQPEALRNFALVAGGAEQLREAMAGFERHVARHPKDAPAQYQLGHLYMHLGRHADALVAYDRAIALEPQQPEFHFARSQLLLLLGRYQEGWREYEWRWRIERFNGSMQRFAQPRWDGRPLDGTLLVHGEAGFGDMFQFIRYARLCAERCQRVIVECQPALLPLVAGVPGVSAVHAQDGPLPHFDAHIPLIAFMGLFGTTQETIPWDGPYIHADPQRVAQWQALVAAAQPRARKVGVVWTGDPNNLNNRERSVSLQKLAGLAQAPNVTVFSLQKGGESARPGEIPAGMHFVDLTERIRDFSDTAALLSQLDLLVTIDTGVCHLAGAMGVPTWVLLPFAADWRYHAGRGDNPWYPTMRLFRQQRQGDWSAPLQGLERAFLDWAAVRA